MYAGLKKKFEAIVYSLEKNRLRVNDLISQVFFLDIKCIWTLSEEKSLGIIIKYPSKKLKLRSKY